MSKKNKEQRKKPRIYTEVKGTILTDDKKIIEGHILNHSEDGLFFRSNQVIKKGASVKIELEDLPTLEGKVVWSQDPSQDKNVALSEKGMGIELILSPQKYLEYVAKNRKKALNEQRSIETRYNLSHRVRLQSEGIDISEITSNISQNGMFVATDAELEINSIVCLEIHIPGMVSPIQIKGRVAHRISPQDGDSKNITAGIGVQFTGESNENRARLEHYLNRVDTYQTRQEKRSNLKLPDEGKLSEYLVPEILIYLFNQRATGTLELTREDLRKTISFHKGHPIFVNSNLRDEMLGHYLLRKEKITEKEFEESLIELENSNMKHGEIMVKRGMLTQEELDLELVSHQEEKIMNTFYWFDGDFKFSHNEEDPSFPSIFSLRIMRIILQGITNWYPHDLIISWTGMSENTLISKMDFEGEEFEIPISMIRLMSHVENDISIKELRTYLKNSFEELSPICFAAMITRWIELKQPMASSPPPKKLPPQKASPVSAPPSPKETVQVKKNFSPELREKIELQFGKNFYELLDLSPDFSDELLKQKFKQRLAEADKIEEHFIVDEDSIQLLSKLRHNIKLAHDILSDASLKPIYDARHRSPSSGNGKSIEIEKTLLSAFLYISQKDYQSAEDVLQEAMTSHPRNHSIQGYLAWVLYQKDPVRNLDHSITLLDQAVSTQSMDAQLWFFLGKISFDQKHWWKAEKCLSRSLRINPKLAKADQLLSQIRDHSAT